MKRLSLSLPALAALGVLGLAVGFGLGRMGRVEVAEEGPADREAGAAASEAVLEPSAVTGSSLAEKAARAEVRAFQPGRPFPTGSAEAWLMGLRAEGFDDSDAPGMAAAFRHLSTLDDASAREVAEAIHAIAERMETDEDGDETVKIWEDHEELLEAAFAAALSIVADADPEAALALLAPLEDGNEEYTGMVWSQIARTAPERLESLLAGVEKEIFPDALRGAVMGLVGSDPEAAMTLLAKYPGKDFEEVRDEAIKRVMATDPLRGVELAAALVRGGEVGAVLGAGIGEWLDRDEDAARKWVDAYTGPGRDAALGRVLAEDAWLLSHDSAADPKSVMEEFAAMRARGVPDEDLSGVSASIVRRLAFDDMKAARDWVASLTEGRAQGEAVQSLGALWVRKDALAASEWIASLPEGWPRDQAVTSLTDAIRLGDPASAFEWARSIADENVRKATMRSVLTTWRAQDSVAAEGSLAAIPERDRNRLAAPRVVQIGPIDSVELEGMPGSISADTYQFVPPGGIPVGSNPVDLFPEE